MNFRPDTGLLQKPNLKKYPFQVNFLSLKKLKMLLGLCRLIIPFSIN